MPGEAPQGPDLVIERPNTHADESHKAVYDLASYVIAAGGGEAAVHPDAPRTSAIQAGLEAHHANVGSSEAQVYDLGPHVQQQTIQPPVNRAA